ncbi:transcription factor EMB1444-like isoform X2 [Phalaenopsis equestris]|uniref:transcription factor EMB1444-like isoform X2 n=1 Tax=Phalaenopsis equestris TaxID=78828 RepID=UPI0009E57C3D|nr:transcription factor EMB1444-like isoform X2 [Phalaenopsis equestris]
MAGELLGRLCNDGGWTYGALWRNDCGDPRLLMLGESYHEEHSGMIFQVVANQVHLIGQGAIGEVAMSGKHRWINLDAICMETSENSSSVNPDMFQTIAIISLPPYGVLQFGSTQKILESSDFIAQAQHLLRQLGIKQHGLENQFYGTPSSNSFGASSKSTMWPIDINSSNYTGNKICPPKAVSELFDIIPTASNSSIIHCVTANPAVCVASSPVDAPNQAFTDNDLFDGMEFNPVPMISRRECWDDIILPVSSNGCADFSADLWNSVSEFEMSSVTGPAKGLFSDSSSFEELLDAVKISTTTKHGHGDAEIPKASPSKCDVEEMMRVSIINDVCSVNAEGPAIHQPEKPEESAKPVRKRARPGENTRPRPKDRQQIQDRVKELREIVPNGVKCSIDSLLDRTIKHMLFLQSITKYVDKLKLPGEPQLIGEESGVVLKDNTNGQEGGATWAYEVAGQTMVCPILLQDVYPSGQLLVEVKKMLISSFIFKLTCILQVSHCPQMLCEERGLFLEIAEVVRGFGLTILKGNMEIRDRKVWARFLVEANRDVTRMDVFLSLVQFLQQKSSFRFSESHKTTISTGVSSLTACKRRSLAPIPMGLADKLR